MTRPTRLEQAVVRFNTVQQARFFVESRGQSFQDYELESANYSKSRDDLQKFIPRDASIQEIDRDFLPNYVFGPNDLVITLGQDGLVVNTAKYLNGQPIIAVNPDPDRFDGVLMPFQTKDLPRVVEAVAENRFRTRKVTMARADMNDGQSLLAFNDFFIGTETQTSARYTIHYGKESEQHISSGIIVSTPAGSTGWLSSFFNMNRGINAFLQGGEGASAFKPPAKDLKVVPPVKKPGGKKGKKSGAEARAFRMDWEERRLVFMVREPFMSKWSQAQIVAGEIPEGNTLTLESHMPEGGVLFSDGMTRDFLEFNSGATAKIKIAAQTAELVTEIV